MVTVKELREVLNDFDDNENVIIWFKWRGDSVVDGALNLCRNGSAIQISGTTVESE